MLTTVTIYINLKYSCNGLKHNSYTVVIFYTVIIEPCLLQLNLFSVNIQVTLLFYCLTCVYGPARWFGKYVSQ